MNLRNQNMAVPKAPSTISLVQDFFLAPSLPDTLSLIRIATGGMIAYIHLIWMSDLAAFMGPNALLNNETWRSLHSSPSADYKWTYLAHTESMGLIWSHEIIALLSGCLMAIGLGTRTMCLIAWFTTLMTTHRMTGLLFGLDQITIMLAMYLCLARPGDQWSVDRGLQHRFPALFLKHSWLSLLTGQSRTSGNGSEHSSAPPSCWTNTLATRLMQLHLCVIYFFGGIGKLRGEMWWDGSALWYTAASFEYQSLDLTWIGYSPIIVSALTHITLFWEVSYAALVWPMKTRPWVLMIAVMVHAGIAIFLGMITFGFMMIVCNFAFVPPAFVRYWAQRTSIN